MAERATIKGTVKTSSSALQGATVALLDVNSNEIPKKSTVTLPDGTFTINITEQEYTALKVNAVKISNIGYVSEIYLYNTGTVDATFTVVLKEKTTELQGVTVVAKRKPPPPLATVTPATRPPLQSPVAGALPALNIQRRPPSAGKGLGNFILVVAKKIAILEKNLDRVFDKALYIPLRTINEVEICNIINFFLSKAKLSLIKDPNFAESWGRIKERIVTVNETISRYTVFTGVQNTPRTVESFAKSSTSNQNKALERQKLFNLLQELRQGPLAELLTIPDTVGRLIPGYKRNKGTIQDILNTVDSYKSFENIPVQDIDKIVGKIYDLQGILTAISSLDSAQDVVALTGLQEQINKLQKVVDPTKLIPAVKKILQISRNINQVGLEIIRYISIIRTVVRVATLLVKAFIFVIQLFRVLALPNMFTVHGITSTLEDAKQLVKDKRKALLKVLTQIDQLLQILAEFVLYLLGKIDLVIRELQILLINLESCKALDEREVVEEIKTTLESLQTTRNTLTQFTDNYFNAANTQKTSVKVPGYTITVIEEEVVDEGKTLKRRRAVAYDSNGLLVLQGDLTFATNTAVLIEEVRLKLTEEGYIESKDSSLNFEEQSLLNTLSDTLDFSDQDLNIESDLDERTQDSVEVQAELGDFILGLKNGRKLKDKVRKKVEAQVQSTKDRVKEQGVQGVSTLPGDQTLKTAVSSTDTTTGSSIGVKILSDSERKKLELLVRTARITKNPGLLAAAVRASKRLEQDDKARRELKNG